MHVSNGIRIIFIEYSNSWVIIIFKAYTSSIQQSNKSLYFLKTPDWLTKLECFLVTQTTTMIWTFFILWLIKSVLKKKPRSTEGQIKRISIHPFYSLLSYSHRFSFSANLNKINKFRAFSSLPKYQNIITLLIWRRPFIMYYILY